MNKLLLVGITLFFGTLTGKIFQRLKIPQIVGYVVLGLILGKTFLGIWSDVLIEEFTPVIHLALGIIGFLIGSELKIDLFKNRGRSIYAILLCESFFAAFFVFLAITLTTGQVYYGLLFGAIAVATAPAATVNVLWEYKTRGPLTTALLAIVALDDATALIIYGFASAFAKTLIAREHFSLYGSIFTPLLEIFTAVGIGMVGGYVLFKLSRFIKDKERIFPFSLGVIVLTIALAIFSKVDLILASMVLGVTLANLAPVESKEIFNFIKRFSPPIYIIFFVLAGAHIDFSLLTQSTIAILGIIYILSRSAGKISGVFLGGIIGKAQKTVTKYLGLSLFSQAGVQIGMALSIYHSLSHFGEEASAIGLTVINVTLATTFLLEILGPLGVRYSVHKAGEVNRNVTEEDIIDLYHVSDLMDKDAHIIRENTPLYSIVETIKDSEAYHFCVVDDKDKLLGIISLGDLRSTFLEQESELNNLVLARDIAVPVAHYIEASQSLKDAIDIFRRKEIDFLPVIEDKNSKKLVGAMHYREVMREIHRRLIERRGNE